MYINENLLSPAERCSECHHPTECPKGCPNWSPPDQHLCDECRWCKTHTAYDHCALTAHEKWCEGSYDRAMETAAATWSDYR